MASTFTTNVNMEIPARGDYVGTWDTPLDLWATYLDAIQGSTTSLALTNVNVTLSQAQQNVMRFALTGTLTGAVTITFLSGKGGRWLVSNTTSGAFAVTLKVGSSTITATQGSTIEVYSDGTTFSTLTGAGVTTARQINSGTMLTGGGDLTADRTISMAALAAVGMLVGSPAGSTTPQAITLGTGLSMTGSTLSATGSSGVTSITAGTGISVNASTGAVTVTATNAGTITAVNAGTGLTGGGSSGNVTLTVAAPCKAWCTFHYNGSSMVIDDSFNVSSVTRNGAGDYTVNFTSSFGNANYAVAGMTTIDFSAGGLGSTWVTVPRVAGAKAAGSIRVNTTGLSGGSPTLFETTGFVSIMCFGN